MVIVEMTEKVRLLLSMQEKDGLQWRGTKRDLLELLHEVYYHCGIVMADGSYATFTYLVGRVFKVFGLVPPRNPSSKAFRAEGRKGVRRASLVSRMESAASAGGREGLERFWEGIVR